MPYTKTTWTNGATALNATNLNNLETQFLQAMTSLNADLFTPFVLSGLTPTGTPGTTTLNVAAGVAYLTQPGSNNDIGRVSKSSSTQTTSTINSTYHLYLQPDGTFYWNTLNSPAANSLAIADVTTNASGQIVTVTDRRTTAVTLLAGMAGLLTLPALGAPVTLKGNAGSNLDVLDVTNTAGGGHRWGLFLDSDNSLHLFDFTNSKDVTLATTAGAAIFPGGLAGLGGQATAGSFGAPVIVAQTVRQHITVTTLQNVLVYSVTTSGIYRISGYILLNNGSNAAPIATLTNSDPDVAATALRFFSTAYAPTSPGHSPVLLDGSAASTFLAGPDPLDLASITVSGKAGTNITCQYQDSAGTPSDWVTFIIERLA